MNKNKLKALLVYHGDDQKSLSEILGVTEQTISDKINGLSDFKLGEIRKIIDHYHLTPDQIDDIFFDDI